MPVYYPALATEKRKHNEALPVISAKAFSPNRSPWREGAKRVFDLGVALLLLILTAPVIVLAALAVRLTSRGPVIYCQTRMGKGGKPYTIFKIRTMVHDCESKTGIRWSLPGDSRITLVGQFLRRLHIDELPQLWNILRGEMSLVGPRPERPEFVIKLEQALPDYRRRLLVRPGLTGLAQVQLPPDRDLSTVRRKLAYDLYYVHRRTLWLDVRIIFSTACTLLAIPFAVSRVILQLPSDNVVAEARHLDLNQAERAGLLPPSLSHVS